MDKAETLKIIGLNIKACRLKAGISQEELAESAGLHRTYISLMERGGKNVGIFNVLIVAKCLNVTIDNLTKGIYEH